MKAEVCDMCMKDGKFTVSSWNHRLGDRVVMHLCNEHHLTHTWNDGPDRQRDLQMMMDAQDKYIELHNAGLAEARRLKKEGK